VKCCAWSPSGAFLASCSRDKSVWFWQVDDDEDFQVSSILQTHTQDVKHIVWHPFEDLLVSCSYDDSLRFYKYDGEDWIVQQRIDSAHGSTIWSCDFSANGTMLVTVGDDRCVKIWKRHPLDQDASHSQWHCTSRLLVSECRWPSYSVSWSSKNDLIAVGCGDNSIRIFKFAASEAEQTLEMVYCQPAAHDQDVNCVAWHPKLHNRLVTAGDDALVKVWTIEL